MTEPHTNQTALRNDRNPLSDPGRSATETMTTTDSPLSLPLVLCSHYPTGVKKKYYYKMKLAVKEFTADPLPVMSAPSSGHLGDFLLG